MTAKTPAQRQAALKARRLAAGLKLLPNLWAHPDDFKDIRAYAGLLARRRARSKTLDNAL